MRLTRIAVVAAAAALMGATPAHAVPDCRGGEPMRTVLSGQGVLESAIGGADGRLYWTDSSANAIMALDGPGDTTPEQVAAPIEEPGGLLLASDGTLVVGSGNGFAQGAAGNVAPQSKLLRVDPATGVVTPFVDGLSMANGLAWGPDGEIYASNDVALGVDRVDGTTVTPRWARVVSSNGLAVDSTGRYLFAAQTFQPPAVVRVDISDPSQTTTYAGGNPEDLFAGLDGMTIDQLDRLFVTANGGGQVWRIGTDGAVCAVARGLLLPSAVALGTAAPGEPGFPATSLFVVTFSGVVAEIPNARPQP